ncbi:MAG: universal stress protein [Nitrospiraceae bacterium]|nr:MAG: universal stress protein [Nitrospiraceae bacterium]
MAEKQACPIASLKNILLATDGSDFSEAAMKQAISISKACSSKLHIISVVEVNPEYEALAPKIVEKAESDTRQLLEWTKECIVKEGIECETIARQGEEPAQFIIEEAEKKKVEMIVMGSHGRKGLKKFLMGSVTQKVLAHTPCSVLVVKA